MPQIFLTINLTATKIEAQPDNQIHIFPMGNPIRYGREN